MGKYEIIVRASLVIVMMLTAAILIVCLIVSNPEVYDIWQLKIISIFCSMLAGSALYNLLQATQMKE